MVGTQKVAVRPSGGHAALPHRSSRACAALKSATISGEARSAPPAISEFRCVLRPGSGEVFPLQCRVQPPGVPVGIARYMGENMTYTPARQPTGAANLVVRQFLCRGQQAGMRGLAQADGGNGVGGEVW